MKRILALATLVLMPFVAAQAGTCLHNIPPSNPDSVYVDHGDGTVTDTRSGLMWKKCAEGQTWNGGGCTGAASTYTWLGALNRAQAATDAGHGDWRLPNLKELLSLVEECRYGPAINDSIFPNASSSFFWSGSPGAHYSDSAWSVYFYDGGAFDYFRGSSNSVRLVRGGQSFASCAASGTVSGTVRDGTTGQTRPGATVTLKGGASTSTDGGGHYSFSGVAPNDYTLVVSLNGYATASVPVTVCGNTSKDVALTTAATVNGGNSQSGYSADPVNTATGNYTFTRTDFKLPGKGLGFSFERAYNSRDGAAGLNGPLGYGWTHNYNIVISEDGSGNATIRHGDGRTVTFAPDGGGGYTPQYGVFDSLVKHGDGSFTLTRTDRTVLQFGSDGRLLSITDRNGNSQTLAYAGGLLSQITDTAGRQIGFTHDGAGHVTRIDFPPGRHVSFAYDGAGNLVSSTDAGGFVTQYAYDAQHQMTSATDPRGHVFVTNVYDDANRVVTSQQDAKGGQTSYVYDPDLGRTTITDALGGVTVHHHDSLLRLIRLDDANGHTSLYRYDAAGNRDQVTDRKGNVTGYAYDTRGNVTGKTDALGQVTHITYDANNNPLTRTDALNQVTQFAYDANGNLVQTTDALGNTATTTYDAAGQPLTLTDALGRVTTNAYDAAGNLVSVTDALGNVTQYTYDAAGRRLSRTDALGRTTQYAYDANDRLVSVTDPAGQTMTYAYDANGNLVSLTDKRGHATTTAYDVKDLPTVVTDALGGQTVTAYDALDRKISVTDPRGKVTGFTYDAVGRLTQVTDALGNTTQYTYDPEGNRLSTTDALGHTTSQVYDALNRRTQASDALGNATTTAYDAVGRVVSTTNAKGQVTSLAYDAIGRLIRVTDAAGGIVTYTYDAVGNRTAMTDPNGLVTAYAYDAANRLVTKTEAGSYVTRYTYDAVGNLVQLTKPDGAVIQYTYDSLDRLVGISYPDGSSVALSYDANGNRLAMTDSLGSSSYAYDDLDRLTSTTDAFGKQVHYAYDAAGNLTSLTYPGNKTVSYAYDDLNRMVSLTDWAGRVTSYGYDAAGRLTGANLPNGTSAVYAYDVADRLTQLSNKSGALSFADYAYTLDALGNHTQVNATEPLAPSGLPGTANYMYDTDNRLYQVNSTSLGHDNNGNLTSRGADSFVWDHADRLKQASVDGVQTSYQYDGAGNRRTRTAGGATTRYVLDVRGSLPRVLAETDAAGTIRAYYVYGLGLTQRIAADGSVRFYHYDSRGSTVALTDLSGTVTDKYAYDPFGKPAGSWGATANPFRYVGKYGLMDEGNGLLFVRARYYDPDTGRFISKDPKSGSDTDSQSLHRYVYAMNNPIRLVDVSGLSASKTTRLTKYYSDTSDAYHQELLAWRAQELIYEDLLHRVGKVSVGLMQHAVDWKVVWDSRGYWKRAPRVGVAGKIAGALSTGLDLYSILSDTYSSLTERGYSWSDYKDAFLNAGDNLKYGIEHPDALLNASIEGITTATAFTINRVTSWATLGAYSDLTGQDVENWISTPSEWLGGHLYNLGHGNAIGNSLGF